MAANGIDRAEAPRDLAVMEREDSGRSSQLSGEFMQNDPKFESPPGSSTSDSELANLAPQAPLVTVVWRQLTVVRIVLAACKTWLSRFLALSKAVRISRRFCAVGLLPPPRLRTRSRDAMLVDCDL